MRWDHETLRTLRKNRFSSIKAFSKASGLAKDAISNVENGYSATRLSTIKRYCSSLNLDYRNFVFEVGAEPEFGLIKLEPPNAIDFRPVNQPTTEDAAWTIHRTAITLLPFSVSVPKSIPEAVSIDSATLRVSCLTNKDGLPLAYFSLYWVALDNTRNSNSMTRSAAWRGEVERFGSGATVQPFYVERGEKDVHEMMFNSPDSPSWKLFVLKLKDIDGDLFCDLAVKYSMSDGRHGTQNCHFHVSGSHVQKTMEQMKRVPAEKFEYGQASFIKLNTKEGRYENALESSSSDDRGE